MSGSGAKKRSEILAIRCANLAEQGWTYRNIADAVGKSPEQIKGLIILGERFKQNYRPIPQRGKE